MSRRALPKHWNEGLERALKIIQSLIHGADPASGAELPADTVINRVDVNRALLVAATALEQMAASAARRAQMPSGVGRFWSPEEEETLRAEFKGDLSIPQIANRHSRTVRAIEERLVRLGLITPDQRTTPASFSARRPRPPEQK
jgi:hypothetical protein